MSVMNSRIRTRELLVGAIGEWSRDLRPYPDRTAYERVYTREGEIKHLGRSSTGSVIAGWSRRDLCEVALKCIRQDSGSAEMTEEERNVLTDEFGPDVFVPPVRPAGPVCGKVPDPDADAEADPIPR